MIGIDRVALIGWLWFIGFIVAGDLIGRGLEMPGTGMVFGFLVALFGILAWPWVVAESLDNSMNDFKA